MTYVYLYTTNFIRSLPIPRWAAPLPRKPSGIAAVPGGSRGAVPAVRVRAGGSRGTPAAVTCRGPARACALSRPPPPAPAARWEEVAATPGSAARGGERRRREGRGAERGLRQGLPLTARGLRAAEGRSRRGRGRLCGSLSASPRRRRGERAGEAGSAPRPAGPRGPASPAASFRSPAAPCLCGGRVRRSGGCRGHLRFSPLGWASLPARPLQRRGGRAAPAGGAGRDETPQGARGPAGA